MERKGDNLKTNVVGIVPIAGTDSNLGSIVPDYLLPIGEDYSALERRIIECANAGCSSIWVVCNNDTAPAVKHVLGDYIVNPDCYNKQGFVRYFNEHKKYIPIFYTAIHPKDRDRRDSLGWSILHGALTAFTISNNISSWLAPKKYFVSFPCGVYDPEYARQCRSSICCNKENFYFSYKGKTVRDGLQIGFSFFPEEWKQIRFSLKKNCSGGSRDLPFIERWSSKNFSLDKIFKNDNIVVEKTLEVEKFSEIKCWNSFTKIANMSLEKDKKRIIISRSKYEGLFND